MLYNYNLTARVDLTGEFDWVRVVGAVVPVWCQKSPARSPAAAGT